MIWYRNIENVLNLNKTNSYLNVKPELLMHNNLGMICFLFVICKVIK
jgi:hypothetical protein